MHSEEEIFEAAAALPGEDRQPYLDHVCAGQPELRTRIEALLRSHEVTGFMDDQNGDFPPPLASKSPGPPPAPTTEQPGDLIGRYKLMEKIGEGGFGVVWVAEQQEPVRRRVALKIIKPGMDSREVIARFEQERQALAMMDHPNIAKVFDAGATDKGRPFFVMELVRGVRITDYCDRENLPTPERLSLFISVCQAVQHAHQKGIIHRDLKPSNILVTPGDDGQPVPKVIDFGVAKAIQQQPLTDGTVYTQFEQMIGTPAYMSPEQAGLGPMDVDTRSDVYSLGVLLYELLTGRPPFDPKELLRAGLDEMRRVIREVEPPKPSTRRTQLLHATDAPGKHPAKARIFPLKSSIAPDLDWIVMKALEKDRARRYESATGLVADLRRHLENQPVLARPPGRAYLLSRFIRRHKIGVAAGVAVSLSVLAGFGAAIWGKKQAEEEAARTELANKANQRNLHLASMADYAAAVKALEEDAEKEWRPSSVGLSDKSRWHEGIALLTRSLEREAANARSAQRIYSEIRESCGLKQNWALHSFGFPDGARSHDAGFSPDGSRIVTADLDNSARIWDSFSGEIVGGPLLHDDSVYIAAFSPSGTHILTVSGGRFSTGKPSFLYVWDAVTGITIGEPIRHESGVKCAGFSPDSTRIVTGSADGTARLWETSTAQPLGEVMHHTEPVFGACFSPDGKRVATASRDHTVKIWDAETGRSIGTPLLHDDQVKNVSFSPDGSRILTRCNYSAHVWDAATGQSIGDPLIHKHRNGILTSANFSPDGTKVITSGLDGTAQIWETTGGLRPPLILSLGGSGVASAEFSPDGMLVVTAADNYARLWEVETGRAFGEPFGPLNFELPSGQGSRAAFNPDGTMILTSAFGGCRIWAVPNGKNATSRARREERGVGRTWSFGNGQSVRRWNLKNEDVSRHGPTDAIFSADGMRILSVGNPTQVWDVTTRKTIGPPLGHALTARFVSGVGQIVAVGENGTVRIWDTESGRPLGTAIRPREHGTRAVLSADGSMVVTAGTDKIARVWNTITGEAIGAPMVHQFATPEGYRIINSAAFFPEGQRIITASGDRNLRLWDVESGNLIGEPIAGDSVNFSPDGSRFMITGSHAQLRDATTLLPIGNKIQIGRYIRSADFSRDGTKFVITANDDTARIWDAATVQPIGAPLQHRSDVTQALFSPDSKRIVTASRDQTARIWDAATGQPIGKPLRHEGTVNTARFSPDGTIIVTACSDHTTRIWSAFTGEAISEPLHKGYVIASSTSQDGARIVTACDEHSWDFLTSDESKAVAAITPAILEWARKVSGIRFSEDGEMIVISDVERLATIRNPSLPAGPWSDLAGWLNAPAPFCKMDVKSKFTYREVAERQRDFENGENLHSLKSALSFDNTVPLARLFLAAAKEKADAAREAKNRVPGIPQRAAFLRRYDLDALAREKGKMKNDELAALWVRAATHLFKLPPETKVGIGPKATTAREEAEKAARKALELVPGLPVAEEVLKQILDSN